MSVSGQLDRTIAPGASDTVTITVSTGTRSGPRNDKVSVSTNDRAMPVVQLDCTANIKAAMHVSPPQVNFAQVPRNSAPLKRVLTLTRGDAGPIAPKLVPAVNQPFSAELREIEAGEKYELTVDVTPPFAGGNLRGTLSLETGVSEAPKETIMISGRMVPRLAASPPQLQYLPKPAQDEERRVVLNWAETPGRVLEALVNDDKLNVRLEEQGGRQMVVLTVPAGFEPQPRKQYQVTVRTDDKEAPTLSIPIYAQAGPATPGGRPAARAPLSVPVKLSPAPSAEAAQPPPPGGER